ncbi:hypothetical protein [Rathayibacter sp. AY1A7]|uniref:hypothetical protein n=1 Tax=Rathayibacter sp. AY1A7 TaxID=2080524 RepID=UPI0011B0DC6C|nr:hypothetical protein [Rathayibacter sp. AY1A7]
MSPVLVHALRLAQARRDLARAELETDEVDARRGPAWLARLIRADRAEVLAHLDRLEGYAQ